MVLIGQRQNGYGEYINLIHKKLTSAYAAEQKCTEAAAAAEESQKMQEQLLTEYKAAIQEKIGRIPFHPSHRKIKETLVISEEGYRAMMEDPAYEKWVLDHIRENRSVDMSVMTGRKDFLSGTDYEYYGAAKEEYHGVGYNTWDYSENGRSSAGGRLQGWSFDKPEDYLLLWQQAARDRRAYWEVREQEYFAHQREQHRQQVTGYREQTRAASPSVRQAHSAYTANFRFVQ